MTADLKPYPELRDSGVRWLGKVPALWGVRRLKSVCSESGLYGANVSAGAYVEHGVRFLRTTDITEDGKLKACGVFLPEELAQDHILADGDVLISRSGTVGRSFLYSRESHGPCSYAGLSGSFCSKRFRSIEVSVLLYENACFFRILAGHGHFVDHRESERRQVLEASFTASSAS